MRLDNRDGFHWNRTREENVSLIKGTHDALKKGSILPWKRANRRTSLSISAREGVILLVIGPWQLASEKQEEFQSEPISGSPDAELPARKREATRGSARFFGNLSQSRIGSEAELNHHGDVHTPHHHYSSSKYFEVWAIADFQKL